MSVVVVLCITVGTATAQPSPHPVKEDAELVIVDSDYADYDGQAVMLKGGVTLEHGLGRILARQATLLRDTPARKRKFSSLQLEEDVTVFLHDGGAFHCERADLDYSSRTGLFFGNEAQEYVTYTDSITNEQGDSAPIVLRGRQMAITMRHLGTGQRASCVVNEIAADSNVTVDYDCEFMAVADHMVYQRYRQDLEGNMRAPMPGIIHLEPEGCDGVCQVTSRQGDLIKAEKIEIDIPHRRVRFHKPRGAIYVTKDWQNLQRIDFSADTLTWDRTNSLLTLQKRVVLYQKDLGKLTCTDEVRVCQDVRGGARELQWIKSNGITELTYIDEEGGEPHFLVCYGTVFVDSVRQLTTLESPIDDGVVAEGRQVFFSDSSGQVYADKMALDYVATERGLAPAKLTIEGGVKIMNDAVAESGARGSVIQYALADVVEYVPGTKQMCLYANEGGRVLFYDRFNKVQISAPAVNVRRDGSTGKKAVEGIGDVRFTFADHEKNTLAESFNLLRPYR